MNEAPKPTNRWKSIAIVALVVALLAVFYFAYLSPQVILPANRYKQADALFAAGQYEDALAAFEALGEYKDSSAQVEKCHTAILDREYDAAAALYEAGKYEEAIAAFEALNGHKDSVAQIEKCQTAILDREYDAAAALYEAGKYEEAITAFEALNGHRDSTERIETCRKDQAYLAAVALFEAGKYEEAIAAFEALDGHKDSAAQIEACQTAIKDRAYDAAVALYEAEKYEEAIAAFEALNGHRDSAAQIEKCQTAIKDREYDAAMALFEAGKYEEAITAFEALDGHKDSTEQIEKCQTAIKNREYNAAVALYEGGKYEEAIAAFEALNGHRDSAAQIEKCQTAILDREYDAAVALFEAGKYEEAIAAFEALDGHKDSAARIETCRKDQAYLAAVAQAESSTEPPAVLQAEPPAEPTAEPQPVNDVTEVPLSLWTDGALARESLQAYMDMITSDGVGYIPPEDRIAVFDLDGTLFCETDPVYFDYSLLLYRVTQDEDYKDKASDFERETARKIQEMILTGKSAQGLEVDHGKCVASAFAGMTIPEFEAYCKKFRELPARGYEGMTIGEGFYRPMLQVVDYLVANDFKVYVVSGTDRLIVRGIVKDSLLKVPMEQIIGSDETLVARQQGDADGLDYVFTKGDDVVLGGEFIVKNLKMNKVTVILQEIGKQPVLSFGNSTGDASMAEFVTNNNPYPSMAFMLCCDDEVRENGSATKAEKMAKLCAEFDWVPISMKDDWTTIYGDGVTRKATPDSVIFDIPEKVQESDVKLSNDASDFVLLSEAVPDAILEIRYYSTYNFIGDRIDGYEEPLALLTKEAAAALREVSDELLTKGYRLKIFDAYRPQRAVTNFMNWALDPDDARMKEYFYPELEKDVLFPQGYIAEHSGHSRGSTVDLTLFDMRTEREVDMGGTFDYFGQLSHPDYTEITEEQYAMRMLLREVMLKHGFKPLEEEWWHFTLNDEPFPDTYFTFPVNSESVPPFDPAAMPANTAAPVQDEMARPTSAPADIDYLALVNKVSALPEGWENALKTVTVTNSVNDAVTVEQKAYDAYLKLKDDLEKNDGIYLELDSAFRSVAQQEDIMTRFIEKYGEDYATKTVAQPGYSEHHTGLALDLYFKLKNEDGTFTDVYHNEDMEKAEYTPIWEKIHSKLADYGFILRYLPGLEHITGYRHELWHIRYVDSVEVAKAIMAEPAMTLEEYLKGQRAPEAAIDLSGSALYSPEELTDAMLAVKCKFAAFAGCELHSIRYGGDEAATEENLAWLNSHKEKASYTKVMKLLTNFHTDADILGAWEPDQEYTDYQWWLGFNAKGEWEIVDWGY